MGRDAARRGSLAEATVQPRPPDCPTALCPGAPPPCRWQYTAVREACGLDPWTRRGIPGWDPEQVGEGSCPEQVPDVPGIPAGPERWRPR